MIYSHFQINYSLIYTPHYKIFYPQYYHNNIKPTYYRLIYNWIYLCYMDLFLKQDPGSDLVSDLFQIYFGVLLLLLFQDRILVRIIVSDLFQIYFGVLLLLLFQDRILIRILFLICSLFDSESCCYSCSIYSVSRIEGRRSKRVNSLPSSSVVVKQILMVKYHQPSVLYLFSS